MKAKKKCTRSPEYIWRHNRKNRTGSFQKKMRTLYRNAKYRAEKLGIEFDFDFEELTPTTKCPVFDEDFDFAKVGRGAADNSPSLDRIDPTKGYVKGNVWVISSKANRMKSDATLAEIERLVERLRLVMKE